MMQVDSSPKDILMRTTAERIGLVVFVVIILTIAARMFWLIEKFADGSAWWDFVA